MLLRDTTKLQMKAQQRNMPLFCRNYNRQQPKPHHWHTDRIEQNVSHLSPTSEIRQLIPGRFSLLSMCHCCQRNETSATSIHHLISRDQSVPECCRPVGRHNEEVGASWLNDGETRLLIWTGPYSNVNRNSNGCSTRWMQVSVFAPRPRVWCGRTRVEMCDVAGVLCFVWYSPKSRRGTAYPHLTVEWWVQGPRAVHNLKDDEVTFLHVVIHNNQSDFVGGLRGNDRDDSKGRDCCE